MAQMITPREGVVIIVYLHQGGGGVHNTRRAIHLYRDPGWCRVSLLNYSVLRSTTLRDAFAPDMPIRRALGHLSLSHRHTGKAHSPRCSWERGKVGAALWYVCIRMRKEAPNTCACRETPNVDVTRTADQNRDVRGRGQQHLKQTPA